MAIESIPCVQDGGRHDHTLLSVDYEGTPYWFCGKGCLLDFQDDPEKYLDPEYTPSM